MPLTRWEMLQAMAAVVLMALLAVLVGVLLVRVTNPLVRRHAWLRGCLKAVGWFLLCSGGLALLVCVASLFHVRTLEIYGLPVLGLLVGGGLYAWGRLAWRFKGEKPIGPRCRKYGYDLAGHDLDVKKPLPCPECGRAMVNRKELFRVPIRKWATRLGVVVVLAGLVLPVGERVYRLGFVGAVPDAVLLRMMVMNIAHDAASRELYNRNVQLENVPSHWTRAIMTSFADAYDRDGVGNGMIFNRFYPLYQASRDDETRAVVLAWASSPSAGKRVTASGMMSQFRHFDRADRLRVLRPLLSDPDLSVQLHALRGLTGDAALPLDELLAFMAKYPAGFNSQEFSVALSKYRAEQAFTARLRLAADTTDPQAERITWDIMFEGFDFTRRTFNDGTLTRLARAKAVLPTVRTAWTNGSHAIRFHAVYRSLVEAAIGLGTDYDEPAAAVWCRRALASYAATGGNGLQSPRSAITAIIDEQLDAQTSPTLAARLRDLRKAISPETLTEGESVPGDSTKAP